MCNIVILMNELLARQITKKMLLMHIITMINDDLLSHRDTRRRIKTPEEMASKPVRPKAPKRGKKDHYADLATQVGNTPDMLQRTSPTSDIGSMPKKHKSTPAGAADTGEELTPPGWFFNYMDKVCCCSMQLRSQWSVSTLLINQSLCV